MSSRSGVVPPDLLLELARAHLASGNSAAALATLEGLPDNPEVAHIRALSFLSLGRLSEAIASFEVVALLSRDATSRLRAFCNAAGVALEEGDRDACSRFLASAEEARSAFGLPEDAVLLLNRARWLAAEGQSAGAEHLLQAALQATEDADLLGVIWLSLGELRAPSAPADAERALRTALSLLRGPAERGRACLALGEILRHSPDAAIEAFSEAVVWLRQSRQTERLVEVLVALGGHLYTRRRLREARQVLEEAGASMPASMLASATEARLCGNLGLCLLAADELDAAQSRLQRAYSLHRAAGRDRAACIQLRALVDLRRYLGDLPGAIAYQAELAALEPQLAEVLPEGGMLYAAVEDRSLSVSVSSIRASGYSPGTGPVLFLVPPAWGASGPLFPRGAVSVASFLETHGIPAQVLPLADVLSPKDDASRAAQKVRDAVRQAVEAYRPRAVGISVTFSYLYPQGCELALLARELCPEGTPILMGGPHVTYLDQEALAQCPALDIIVRGEGEWTALAVLQALSAGAALSEVDGITYRAPDGSIQRNKNRKLGDVRALPPVNFGLLPATFAHRMDVSALTSRGCAFRCRFCHEFRYWGGVVREYPVSRILGEIERLARFGNHLQGIDDSMLDMSKPLFMELIDGLGHSNNIPPDFGLLTRLDTVTEEGSRAMKRAGLRWVSMGAESGSQVVLDAMNKGLAVEVAARSLRIVRDAGLEAATFFIVGHPGDNRHESEVTLSFLDYLWKEDLVSWVDCSTFSPYPGTPFYSMPHKYGVRILTDDWSRWRRSNRPVAELVDYPAASIYQTYLQMLAVQAKYRGPLGRHRDVVQHP